MPIKKEPATKRLTVSTRGVFSEGVRQTSPDPRQVAQVLAAPEPLSLWVQDASIIDALRLVIQVASGELAAVQAPSHFKNSQSQSEEISANLSLFDAPAQDQASAALTPDENEAIADAHAAQSFEATANADIVGIGLEADELLWGQNGTGGASLVERFKTRFYPVTGGVGFFAGGAPFFLPIPEREAAFVIARLTARNAALGLLTPPELIALESRAHDDISALAATARVDAENITTSGTVEARGDSDEMQPLVSEAVHYYLHTGQEIDILERSAADGKRGENWKNEEIVGKMIYQANGASHRVELRQNDENETQQGHEDLNLATLEQLTLSQDTDFAFAMLYVVAALAPPAPLAANQFTGGWIDLDDVMEKIGWYPGELNIADRVAKRARIWDYLCYGNRAVVVGQRSGFYRDSATGEQISTRIESPIWRIMSTERPVQDGAEGRVPRRVQLVISKEWEPMLVSAKLAQYLPMAEVIGQIPPHKVAGDWARSIALVLARLWRMKPQQFLAGQLRPTRRELLTHYNPKTKTVGELLSSSNPKRAVKYWHDALSILRESGFLAPRGEVNRTIAQMLEGHPTYRWQESWLDETIELHPAQTLLLSLQERAAALPAPPPTGKKRGRPRKKKVD